ncbi:hypothetical protein FQN54_006036 [Arachnomyces sp. PD_36]|nr:hypothetical protein FQN54_006036 [Arachnomyces sp. PD_36]
MRLNEGVAIASSAVVLVPYSKNHVPKYHSWMEDEEIREATASELLTLDEEYAMQESWRRDADKLTFIVCSLSLLGNEGNQTPKQLPPEGASSPSCMVGDVNMFLRLEDEEQPQDDTDACDGQEPNQQLVGELELMIAERGQRRQGYGRAALLCFLRYILENESSIVEEFFAQECLARFKGIRKISYLSVKIGETNIKSLALFESLGFTRVTEKANVFGELELRRNDLRANWALDMLGRYDICDYTEIPYHEKESM